MFLSTQRNFKLTLILLFVVGTLTSQAQRRKRNAQPEVVAKPAVFDSARWRAEHYVVDRDSANIDPRVALRKLMGGNRRFVENKSIKPRQDAAALKGVSSTQKPYAVIVGCSDSRVPNEIVFDQGVGDLFIVRTAGQAMAAASYGSIEYAAVVLKSKLVLVLGHQKCGAVDAAVKRPDNPPGHIVALINAIKPAVQKVKTMGGDILANAVRQNVIDQVNELRDLEPVLSKMYHDGEILIVGGVYDLATGKVEFLPETLKGLPVVKVATNNTKADH